jgi:hypothetical protein
MFTYKHIVVCSYCQNHLTYCCCRYVICACCYCRLSEVYLLPLARLVEKNTQRPEKFKFDYSLIAALLDRWRPESNTFHLNIGETTLTPEDVTMILGLPFDGKPVLDVDVDENWRAKLNERFSGIPRKPGNEVPPVKDIGSNQKFGPPLSWLRSLSVR